MIDLHCHILPGLDDGAQTLEDALEMARIAVADGITDIVATPHTRDGVYRNDAEAVLAAVESFQRELEAAEIPLRIHPGAEVHVHVEFVENLLDGNTLTIGNGRKYVLLELPVQSIPRFTDELIYELSVEGITPIIAHPERNVALRENPNRLAEWIEQGAIAQVTAGSLLGKMGERAKKTAELMVQRRLVHVVASDAHNSGRRRPELGEAYRVLASLVDEEEATRYQVNASAVLQGGSCTVLEPAQVVAKKKRFFFF
ncbi:MAG TPA: CpsB/CapC family capsule biosynthesis tyrosine phosphatase [Bacilli bacterium]|nr:CpsB/CapC family capsule biosynthesis tyrosine phosphatase [Bacilli bacterium]